MSFFILFFQEIESNMRKQEEELRKAQAFNSSVKSVSINRPRTALPDEPQGFLHGTITNIIVILGFAAFVYTVKHILLSILDDWARPAILLVHAPSVCQSDLTIVGLTSVFVVWFSNLGNLISAMATESMIVVVSGCHILFVLSCRWCCSHVLITGIGNNVWLDVSWVQFDICWKWDKMMDLLGWAFFRIVVLLYLRIYLLAVRAWAVNKLKCIAWVVANLTSLIINKVSFWNSSSSTIKMVGVQVHLWLCLSV